MNSFDRLLLALTCAVSLATLAMASVTAAWQYSERSSLCIHAYIGLEVDQGTLLLPRTLCPPVASPRAP